MNIAVITPTVPDRSSLLEQCKDSVKVQTIPCSHFIKTDLERKGCGTIRNEVVSKLDPSFDWLAFLDDDDLFLFNHLEVLSAHADCDVVYSDCETIGWSRNWTTRSFDRKELEKKNYIPVTVLIRRSIFEQAGGFSKVFAEDWDLWKRLASQGAKFHYEPKVTWLYRQLPGYSRMYEWNR